MRHIDLFDLDGTAIDSFERVAPCLDEHGNLNLEMYIATACTPEKVMTDKLLPLATYMKQRVNSGDTVGIVTARYMNSQDYYYLRKNGLQKSNVIICSRDRLAGVFGKEEAKRINALPDAEYKRVWFTHLWHTLPNSRFTMYDDHQGVLSVAQEMGITAIDATAINKMLEQQFVAGFEQGYDDADCMTDSYMQDVLQCYQNQQDVELLANC